MGRNHSFFDANNSNHSPSRVAGSTDKDTFIMKFSTAAMVVLATTTFIRSSTALALPLNGKAIMKRLLARQNYDITYVTETADASPTAAASDSVVYETVYVTVGADGSAISQPTATLDAVATTAIATTTPSASSTTLYSRTRRTPTTQPTQTASPSTTSPSAASSATSSSSSSAGGDWQDEVLSSHNQYRSLHSASALTWDDTLASYAQQHASSCVFQHTGGPYGENLAAGYSSGSASVDAWYAEGAQYSYADGTFSDATGHFTQVVWVGSQSVGCAWVSVQWRRRHTWRSKFQKFITKIYRSLIIIVPHVRVLSCRQRFGRVSAECLG